jgi:subtilisin family serine protease
MHSSSGKSLLETLRQRRAQPMVAPTLLAAACALALASAAQAQSRSGAAAPRVPSLAVAPVASAESAALPQDEMLYNADGTVRTIVQFTEPAAIASRSGLRVDNPAHREEMTAYSANLRSAKASRVAALARMGARVQNTTEWAFNGAVIDVSPERYAEIRRMPGVKAVGPAGAYRMSQATPPTVGQLLGTAQVNAGANTGQGVAIAIIDSGVDYTHAAFQGPGTTAYYATAVSGANPTVITDTPGVFPNGPRVKGGYDWLGETWSIVNNVVVGTVTPDPDPIDNRQPGETGAGAGHGTNSASAAAGNAVPASNIRDGSAPGAFILAYRGCARASSACEGSALLNSIDSIVQYAAGLPNAGQPGANNPTLGGTRFVINMSLGSAYGNALTNGLAEAARNAVRAGITVVASAGNSNDIPFIVGTPSAADTVISVAASEPATLTGPTLTVGAPLNKTYAMIAGSFGVPFTAPQTRELRLGGINNTPANLVNLACSPTINQPLPPAPNPPIPAMNGAFGLADRGTCEFAEKAFNLQRAGGTTRSAGASASIIINNAAGAGPFGMAVGQAGPRVNTPAYSIGTAEGLEIKQAMIANPGLQGTITPLGDAPNVAGGLNLVDQMSSFTSRGPSQAGLSLKPDITAPGTNIWMANHTTGTGGNANSGTSFSSPLTAGAAALVLSRFPQFTPWQVKAALMNTATTEMFKAKASSTLAPLPLMGAGRVQADTAVALGTLAYDSEDVDPTAATSYFNTAASFGLVSFPANGSVSRTIVVQNLTNSPRTYNLSVAPRFANDLARGMTFSTSTPTITVPANSTGTFQLIGTAVAASLPVETAGALAGFPREVTNDDTCTTTANPPAPVVACTDKFTELEQDGFVTIDGGAGNVVRVPYLAYPRQASQVVPAVAGNTVTTNNTGVGRTAVEVFTLVGGEDAQDQPALVPGSGVLPVDLRAVGVRFVPNGFTGTLPTGITSPNLLQVGVSFWNALETLRTATVNVEIDTNNDGVTDFTVRNLNTTENRNAAFITTGFSGANGNAFFRPDFILGSNRMIMTVFTSPMGITATSRIGIRVTTSNGSSATNPVLDTLGGGGFQYVKLDQLVNAPSSSSYIVNGGAAGSFTVASTAANGDAAISPGDKGLLVIATENGNADRPAVIALP